MYTSQTIMADFKTTPYKHQMQEFEAHGLDEARALLWQMRCGKTKLIIDSACALFADGKIDAVLVFAPNGVHANWTTKELPLHHWYTVPYVPLCWNSYVCGAKSEKGKTKAWREANSVWATEFKEAAADLSRLLWFSVNSEIMYRDDVRKTIEALLKKRKTMVVFDESHNYHSPSTARTRAAKAIAKKCAYRRILTGTVVTNSPLHAFCQYELLQPGALGHRTYTEYKNTYAEFITARNKKGQSFPVLKKYQNLDQLKNRLAKWSSVILREDCDDLPDIEYRRISVELSPEQQAIYKQLHSKFEIEVGDSSVNVGENAAKLVKLQQVVSGFVIDEYKTVHVIPGRNARMDALRQEVYTSPGKVIIWCQFRYDIDMVYKNLIGDNHIIMQYHGRTSSEDKALVRKAFASGAENDVKGIVGHPQSGGQGLDLSAASKIIWYSHTFDAIIRGQADERATRIGGRNIQIVDIVAPGIDEYIIDCVQNKKSVAEDLAGTGLKETLERLKI